MAEIHPLRTVNPPDPKSPSPTARKTWQPPSLAELKALLPAYEFLSLLGRGGMGAVFKATQISLNRPVAIKVLPVDLMEDEDSNFTARFRQEALTMEELHGSTDGLRAETEKLRRDIAFSIKTVHMAIGRMSEKDADEWVKRNFNR